MKLLCYFNRESQEMTTHSRDLIHVQCVHSDFLNRSVLLS